MGDMEEDRVYADRREETVAYVATGQGVATVRVSSDRVGRFALAERCRARDVAAGEGRVYVATDEDVLVGPDPFEPLEFGGAVAVGVGEWPLAADEKGWVSRYRDGEWSVVGSVDAVRAIDCDLVAADDGVYRVDGDDLAHVGLSRARDVAGDGVPLAVTDDGLYRLGNGWLHEIEGTFGVVAADGDHAHAATADSADAHAVTADSDDTDTATVDRLYERGDDGWTPANLPVAEPVAGVGYGECVYAVTERGTFLVDADPERTPDGTGGWRSRSLGLRDVSGLAVL